MSGQPPPNSKSKSDQGSNIMLALLPGESESPGNCCFEGHRPNNSLAPHLEFYQMALLRDDRSGPDEPRLIPNVRLLFCTEGHAVAWLRAQGGPKQALLQKVAKEFEESEPLLPE